MCIRDSHWMVRAVCGSSANMSGWTSYNTFVTLSGSRISIVSDAESNLNIYPNPTRGFVNISFISEEIDNFEIQMLDPFGKLIIEENKKQFIGEYTKKIDLSNYPKGMYFLQIRTNDKFISRRIILQ